MKKIIQKYYPFSFEQGSTNSEEMKQFGKDFKNAFKKELTNIGATLEAFNVGHFYISGFYKRGEQLYYFSWHNGDTNLMYRTAQHLKDFSGGTNNWVRISEDLVIQLKK